jgi:hypothetical protein
VIDTFPPRPGIFGGVKVVIAAETAKMKLSADLPVTDQFRKEIDDWMLKFFGTTCYVPEGQVITLDCNTVIVHPRTYNEMLKIVR